MKQARHDMFTLACRGLFGIEVVREYRFHATRRWRFDYAAPSLRVALEVEGGVWTGGRHISPNGFLGDVEKYNAAALLGWVVLRTTPDRLMTEGVALMREIINLKTKEK